ATDLTIAVNLGGKIDINEKITTDNDSMSENSSPFTEKITQFVEKFKNSTVNHISKEWDAYDIANQAFDAMQSTIARQKLAAYPADYYIEIAQNSCGTLEFNLASEMIELGYKKADESLGKIS
ncbi:MAG: serine protease, partial [Thiotrichaceae bacterium]|nr:serine protease [Thiotrichaceae bacterium]